MGNGRYLTSSYHGIPTGWHVMPLACSRHRVALRATISHWLSSLASAWYLGSYE